MIRQGRAISFSFTFAASLHLAGCASVAPSSHPASHQAGYPPAEAPRVVRAQGGTYGGTAVGATSPHDVRQPASYQPNLPAYPTAGSSAWQQNPPARAGMPPAAAIPQQHPGYAPYTGSAPQVGPHSPFVTTAVPTTPPHEVFPRGAGVDPNFVTPFGPPDPNYGLLTPLGTAKDLDIDAIVHEARTGRLMVGAGINSDAGLIGQIVIEEQNFDWRRIPTSWDDIRNGTAWRGGGQRFRIEAMPGTVVERYLVSFTEPYLFDTPISLGLSGYFYDRRFYDWDERRGGARISLGYQLPDDWSITGALRAEQVEVHSPRVLPPVPELARVLGDNEAFSFRAALTHDVRDSAFLPTQGHFFEVAYEQVFGSFDYPVGTIEARKYHTLSERIDGSGRQVLSVGGIVGASGEDTPVYDNFFAGGFSTLRGFQFRSASPKTGDTVVGGRFQMLGTVEYMFPITADDMLRGVVFCDAGTVERDIEINGDSFRVAPGFGLRIAHPGLGPAPIALDLAFPVLRDDSDRIRNFTFFIGIRR